MFINEAQSLLVDGPLAAPATFSLDFSDGTGGSVGEPSLDENQGLARAGSGWVDYDDDSVVDNPLLDEDINFDGSIVDTHTDFDDWGNLNLFFVRSLSGHAEGFGPAARVIDPVGDDRQPVYPETPFPDRFRPTP